MKDQFEFEKFNVYQKAESFYTKVIKILSNSRIDKAIKDQLKRASLSIVLNIAEGSEFIEKSAKGGVVAITERRSNFF